MAVIGEIRKRSGLVLVLVGGALVAFILGDALSNQGGPSNEQRIGEAFGNDITNLEFDTRVERQVQAQSDFGGAVTEEARRQIRDQVWSQMIRELVLDPEMDALGLAVADDEYYDMISGENIAPSLAQDPTFQNQETQQYDVERALQALDYIETNNPAYYVQLKQNLMIERRFDKYRNLIKKGMYATTNEAKQTYDSNNETVKFNFVIKKYSSIMDSTLVYTDADVEAYYNEHKNEARFEQKQESRSVDYVSFNIVPSRSDSAFEMDELNKMKSELMDAQDDSAYCYNNTDANTSNFGFSVASYYRSGDRAGELDSMFMQADSGAVLGPYEDLGVLKLAKVTGFRMGADSAKCRHILISTPARGQGDRTAQKALADSLYDALKEDITKFDAFVEEFSGDPGKTENGGTYDWFGPGVMVPEFEAACFYNDPGTLTIAETDFGFHIVEVLDNAGENKEVKKVELEQHIKASDFTADSLFSLASEFAINNDNAEAFDKAAEEKGYTVLPATGLVAGAQGVGGIPNSRPIITWAYGAETGDVSETFDLGQSIVVAKLSVIREEGVPSLEANRQNFEQAMKQQMKADMYIEQMAGVNDLQTLADKIGESVLPVETMAFSSYTIVGGGGDEPEVVGQIFAMEPGQVSAPIQGKTGVYVVQLESKTPAAETTDNYQSNRMQVMQAMANRVDYEVFGALQKAAGVKDERNRIY